MRRLIAGLSVLLAASGASFALEAPASATVTGLCGSNSKLWASTPYNDDSLLQHFISTRGYLTCGPYNAKHQWKVKVQLQQYYSGAWHIVATTTGLWRTSTTGTASTSAASIYCLGHTAYKFRAHAYGYWRSSSTATTATIGSTYSTTATHYC